MLLFPVLSSIKQYSELLYNISRVILLAARTAIKSGSNKGANIISCGGSGFVRFWNAFDCILVGEFAAHPNGTLNFSCHTAYDFT